MHAQHFNKIAVWKSTYVNTMEFTTLHIKNDIVVNGQITGEALGKLLHVNYTLDINNKWEVQSFRIDLQSDTSFIISLHKNKTGQ